MRPPSVAIAVAAGLSLIACLVVAQTAEKPAGPPPPPPPRAIPGLNAPDPHPHGCVDCHVNMKDFNMDVRISTLMKRWEAGVEPKLLAAARASAPDSSKITGRHPKVANPGKNVPRSCLVCHGATATAVPPFARLMHVVHLVGDSSLYMGYYQGDCTHCHKLDVKSGRWSVPSAMEPAGD